MKKVILAFLLACTTFLFEGCELDSGENFHFVALQITEANVPESFNLNQTHGIEVTYVLPDGCTSFEGLDVSSVDPTTIVVVAIGSSRTDTDTACTLAVQEATEPLSVPIRFMGPYLFRFYTGDDDNGNPQYLEYEIPVNTEPSN